MDRITRRNWLRLGMGAALGAPSALGLSPQTMSVRLSGGNFLRVFAPQLHFLTGKTLDRLKDGGTVAFLGQLSVSLDDHVTVQARSVARFALSYDIWEERFSATRLPLARAEAPPKSVSHLSAPAAETWCLDNMSLDASPLPPDRPIWVRLEWRVEESRDANGIVGDPGINLTRLIEIFSQPARIRQPSWQLDAGPLKLASLRRPG